MKEKMGSSLMVHKAYLGVLDTLIIAKNAKRMIGVQKWKDHSGNADRGGSIKGHHWGIIGLISFSALLNRYLCLPTSMQLIPGQLNPFQFIVDPNGVATLATIWDSVLPLIFQLYEQLNHAPLRMVVDAYFCKAPFINPLLEKGIHVITKMRIDAVGWDDPLYCGKGRRPDKGKKWKLATLLECFQSEWVEAHIYGKLAEVKAVCHVVWVRDVKKKVKVVVIEGVKEPVILLCTDLTLTAAQIIEIYAARFSVELVIRDLKGHFGLADYQCYLSLAFHRFVHLACVAFCLFRLIQLQEDTSQWMPDAKGEFAPLSFNRIRRGLQTFAISKILSPKFGELPNLEKCKTELDAILRIAA